MRLPPPPWIVGHRGAAGELPENTLPSFLRAVEQGADMIELDLQLTADRRLAVVHDWDLGRLAGEPGRVVEEGTLADLQRVRMERGGSIPSLAQVFAALPGDFPVNIELKRRRSEPGLFCDALLAAAAGRAEVLYSSFDWDLLAELRRRDSKASLAPLGEKTEDALLDAARRLQAWSVHCHRRLAAPALVEAARAGGLPLLVYTVNDADEARRLFALGVSGVFTDLPGRLRGTAPSNPERGLPSRPESL